VNSYYMELMTAMIGECQYIYCIVRVLIIKTLARGLGWNAPCADHH
jgi:hypothetical protein